MWAHEVSSMFLRIELFVVLSLASLAVACGNDSRRMLTTSDASTDGHAAADMTSGDAGEDAADDMPVVMETDAGETGDSGDVTDSDVIIDSSVDMTLPGTGACDAPLNFNAIATVGPDDVLSFSGDTAAAPDAQRGTCGSFGGYDIAFVYTPAADGLLVVDTEGSHFDTVVFARSSCGDTATQIGCDDDGGTGTGPSRMSILVAHGTPVFLFVDGYDDGDHGAFTLNTHLVSVAPAGGACEPDGSGLRCAPHLICAPAVGGGHTCTSGVDLGCGVDVPVYDLTLVDGVGHFATTTATTANGVTGSCTAAGGSDNDVAFKFTMPVTGRFSVDLGVSFDSATYVYQGSCGGAELLCSDSPDFAAMYVPLITAGTVVYVVVDGWHSGSHGEFTMDLVISPSAGT